MSQPIKVSPKNYLAIMCGFWHRFMNDIFKTDKYILPEGTLPFKFGDRINGGWATPPSMRRQGAKTLISMSRILIWIGKVSILWCPVLLIYYRLWILNFINKIPKSLALYFCRDDKTFSSIWILIIRVIHPIVTF